MPRESSLHRLPVCEVRGTASLYMHASLVQLRLKAVAEPGLLQYYMTLLFYHSDPYYQSRIHVMGRCGMTTLLLFAGTRLLGSSYGRASWVTGGHAGYCRASKPTQRD